MFGFGKKSGKSLKGKHAHTTSRQDWEIVMTELFDHLINGWAHGLVLISNTVRTDMSDMKGSVFPNVSIHMRPSLAEELKNAIRAFRRTEFDRIFKLADTRAPDTSDCYTVKNLGLPNNALVYLIQQSQRSGSSKKAMLVFQGPIVKQQLEMQLKKINEILAKPGRDVETPHEGPPPPNPISRRNLQKTQEDLIKKRLNYLETLDSKSNEQLKEQKMLDEYLIHLFSKSFDK